MREENDPYSYEPQSYEKRMMIEKFRRVEQKRLEEEKRRAMEYKRNRFEKEREHLKSLMPEPLFGIRTYVNVPAGYQHAYTAQMMNEELIIIEVGEKRDVDAVNAYIRYVFRKETRAPNHPMVTLDETYLVFEDEKEDLVAVKVTNELTRHHKQFLDGTNTAGNTVER